jgi:hypothetical protein
MCFSFKNKDISKGPQTFEQQCMSWMAGSLAPVMYWAVCGTLCSTLRSEAEQLPYQAVMQPIRMLSMVQLYNFLRTWGTIANLFSLLRWKRCCRALFTTVLVCLDHDSLLVMWTPRNLKLLTPLQPRRCMLSIRSYTCFVHSIPLEVEDIYI